MSLELPYGLRVKSPNAPVDDKYLNEGVPYTGVTQANTLIVSGIRHVGLTVNINNVEYWYFSGVTDSDLIEKTPSVVAAGGITGATNGLTKTGDAKVALGGALTGDTTISGEGAHSLLFDSAVNFTVNGDQISLNVVGSGEAPLSTWTLVDSDSYNINDMTYGNNMFVAVGENGTIYTSSDEGATWSTQTAPSTNDWNSVVYGGGQFVAVADNGLISQQVMTSNDGVNWTSRTAALDENWDAVTYGNGVYIAVGADVIMTSPDAITWTSRTAPDAGEGFSYAWTAVAYGNGVFVAVENGGAVMYSSDSGVTWTLATTPSTDFWSDVTFGNNLFVAVASSNVNGGAIMTSPDGINWTVRSYVDSEDKVWRAVTYGNGMFVAVSSNGFQDGDDIIFSSDGITWELVPNGAIPSEADSGYYTIASGSENFVATSESGYIITSPASSGASGEIVSLEIAESGSTFTDGRQVTKGIEYSADYSAGFAKHTLVDNHYVTGLTSTIEANSITTANNGLTKSGNNVRLGGILTGDTVISGASHSLTLGSLTPASYLDKFEVNADVVEIWGENGLNLYGDGTSGVFVGSLDSKTVVDASDGLGDNSAKIEATPTNMLIKVEDQNHTADASINMDTQTVDLKVLEGGEAMNQILIDIDSIDITQTNGINGINIHTVGNLNLNADGINVETAGSGMTYIADYSAGFSKHSIVDVNYVTGLTTTSGVQTANNGLTKNGTNVRLGGALTGDTSIDANGNSFTIENYDGGLFLNDTTGGGTWIQDTGAGGVYIDSDGGISIDAQDGGVSLRADGDFNGIILDARDASQVSRTNLYLSPTVARFSDSRTGSTAVGIVYNADYSANFTNRSLVDKEYVDNLAAGLDPKEAVKVATAAELTGATYVATGGTFGSGAFTSAPSIVDGYNVVVGDRILVKNQSDLKQNGIYYVVSASNWYRATDMDGTPANEVSTGNFVFVTTGNTNVASGWVVVGSGDTLTLNVDDVKWAQFSAAIGAYLAGDGIDIVGATISVDLAVNGGLEISGEELQLSSSIAGDGLDYASGVLSLDLASSGGLEISSGELQLSSSIAGDGIDYNAGVISLDANVAGDGLDYNAGVISLDANVAGDGLDYNAGVISVSSEILNGVHTANNGLTKSGTNVRLGGALTGSTYLTWVDTSFGNVDNSVNFMTGTLGSKALEVSADYQVGLDNNQTILEVSGPRMRVTNENRIENIFSTVDVKSSGLNVQIDTDSFSKWSNLNVGGLTNIHANPAGPAVTTQIFDGTSMHEFFVSEYGIEFNINNGDTDVANFLLTKTGTTFTDGRTGATTAGIEYASDYSAGFEKHSLVDVNYVTGLTSTSGVQTANNGLTKNGTNVQLGGALTGNTNVDTNSNTLTLGKAYSNSEPFGENGIGVGTYAKPYGNDSVAIGRYANASGFASAALGNWAMAYGAYSVAISAGYTASGATNAIAFIGGSAYGITSVAFGTDSRAMGERSFAFGQDTRAVGTLSLAGGSGDGTRDIYSGGHTSFNFSHNTSSATVGHGANADFSSILGGQNHNIESGNTRAAIIGGDGINLTGSSYIDTTAVSNLAIFSAPATGVTGNSVLVWDSVDKKVKVVSQESIAMAGANAITANNGLTKSGSNVYLGGELTGNTNISSAYSAGYISNTNNISLGVSSSSYAFGVTSDYEDNFTKGYSRFSVKSFAGTSLYFDDKEGDKNELRVSSAGISATANGYYNSKTAHLNVSNAQQYGKVDEQPQVYLYIQEEDGSLNEVLFSPYGFDINFKNDDDDVVSRFIITKTGTTFTDGRTGSTTAGIEYAADYSSGFEKHSLVDVNYVTGLTSSIKVNKLTVGSVTGNTTLTNNDHVVMVNTSSTGATISLPASPQDGQVYHIKDKSGNALSNSIVISGNGNNIDGASTATINTDYGSLYIVFSEVDSEWYTLAFVN